SMDPLRVPRSNRYGRLSRRAGRSHTGCPGAAPQSHVCCRSPAERRCCPMRLETLIPLTPRMEEAVHELQRRITERFPQAAFVIEEGFDPKGTYLVTTVDIADADEVMDVVGDRLVELQVEEGLPVYVTPLRPLKRVVAQLREQEITTLPSPLPLT